MNCSCACAIAGCAIAVVPNATAKAKVTFIMLFSLSGRPCWPALEALVFGRCDAPPRTVIGFQPMPSLGVRPEPELLLAWRPKSSKAMRLDDQEPADQRADDDEDRQRHRFHRKRDAECMRHLIEQNRQHQDEG